MTTRILSTTVTDSHGKTATTAASISVSPPPPPPSGTRFGVSGGNSVSKSISDTHAKILRAFGTQIAALPAGMPAVYSDDGDGASIQALLNGDPNPWIAKMRANLRDDAIHFVIAGHEWNNDADAATKKLWQPKVQGTLRKALDTVNATRTHKILLSITTTGNVASVGGPASSWWVPVADVWGPDIYDLNRYAENFAFAKSIGKPMILPEFGDGSGATSTKNDADKLTALKAHVAKIQGGAAAGAPVLAACEFNNRESIISGYPQTLAYYQGVCDASAA